MTIFEAVERLEELFPNTAVSVEIELASYHKVPMVRLYCADIGYTSPYPTFEGALKALLCLERSDIETEIP